MINRPSLARISELLRVDIAAGRAYWVSPPKNHPRMQGMEAGALCPNHSRKLYCVIKIDRHAVKRGHLVFFIAHGRWPAPCLDHINGDSTDDRIANIREATVTQNAWNHKRRAKGSPLPMGVRTTSSGRYQARLAVNKKMRHLGVFDTPEQAQTAYQLARKEAFGEFA